jgi:CBS domain-containing protein
LNNPAVDTEAETMTQTVAEVMTPNPVILSADASVIEAAVAMRDQDIGDVIVRDGETLCGIVTDRDLVVRALADRLDPQDVLLREICSDALTTVDLDMSIEDAAALMRNKALRRLPVVDHDTAVGIVTLGDLAATRDPNSALADISTATPNT